MPGTALCPTLDTLLQFLLGLTPPEEAEDLMQHLETCSTCLASARTLQPADPLVSSLRSARTLTETPPTRVLADLMQSLRQLKSSPKVSGQVKRAHGFLAPPRAAGELGWLGPYRVLRELGRGGMGLVFEAEDPNLQRRVAMKVMQPDWAVRPVARQRFLREARAVAALDHDHVITIHHVGEADGIPYLVMPLLQGETLATRLMRCKQLPPLEAMRLAREIALGLDAAHERGLIHRDIKPANIWLENLPVQVGGTVVRDRAKLLDFGLAWVADTETPLTPPEVMMGTPAYMAPELARGKKFDARCDIFSLGCVLHQMLTGQLPFGGLDPRTALQELLTSDPRPAHELNPEVPPRLSALVLKMLAKNAEARPASAQAVIVELKAIAAEVPPRPEPPRSPSPETKSRTTRETHKGPKVEGAPPTSMAPTALSKSPMALVPKDKVRVQTVKDFRQHFIRSKLLPDGGAEAAYRRWLGEAGKEADNLDRYTTWLVEKEYLTRYQAALLIRGHGQSFYLNQYKILDRIGEGRMAGVYKAVHQLGQVVAIKVLPPSKIKDKESFGRFQREARLAMQLKHPNVVRTFQASVAGEGRYHYLIMEHLEGETLEELLKKRKRLPPQEAARVIYQALLGLQHIHEQGMVHRDLKPGNLMLVPTEDAPATVKILDIGLGRAFFDLSSQLTNEESALGTPAFMSPEQARNAHTVDIRADIYSLGCVLFQALTGQPPFGDDGPVRQMIRHATEAPPRLRSLNPEVSDELQAVMDSMLAKDPAQRYPTPERAAQALQAVLSGSYQPKPQEGDPRMQSFLKWLETSDAEDNEADSALEWVPPPGGSSVSMGGQKQPPPSRPAVPKVDQPPVRTKAAPQPEPESEEVELEPRSPVALLGIGAVVGVIGLLAVAGTVWFLLNGMPR